MGMSYVPSLVEVIPKIVTIVIQLAAALSVNAIYDILKYVVTDLVKSLKSQNKKRRIKNTVIKINCNGITSSFSINISLTEDQIQKITDAAIESFISKMR